MFYKSLISVFHECPIVANKFWNLYASSEDYTPIFDILKTEFGLTIDLDKKQFIFESEKHYTLFLLKYGQNSIS